MKRILSSLIMILVSVSCVWAQQANPQPTKIAEGWRADPRTTYESGIDHTIVHKGKAAASIKFIGTDGKEQFGNIGQGIVADAYRNKRVRLSGYIKTSNADEAGLWLRIDGKEPWDMIALDNMGTRTIKGTKEWTRCEIVLDVPDDADGLVFGALLAGKGQAWIDSLKLEVVGKNVKTTEAHIPSKEERAKNNEAMKNKIEEYKRTHPQEAEEREKKIAEERKKRLFPKAINLDFELK